MKTIITCSLIILLFGITYSQNDRLHMYKLPDKQCKRTIKKGAYIEVGIKYYNKDSLRTEDLFEGNFLELKKDSIFMDLGRKTKYIYQDEGILEQNIISRGFCAKPLPYKEEMISLDDISLIKYRNKSAIVFRKISTITFWTSFLTTIMVAPLASINYKQGTFNFDRYKTIVAVGGAGIAVSIPILILSGKKKVVMKEGLHHIDKSMWTFEK